MLLLFKSQLIATYTYYSYALSLNLVKAEHNINNSCMTLIHRNFLHSCL